MFKTKKMSRVKYYVQGQIIQTNPICMSRVKYALIILCPRSNISSSGSNIPFQSQISHDSTCRLIYIMFRLKYVMFWTTQLFHIQGQKLQKTFNMFFMDQIYHLLGENVFLTYSIFFSETIKEILVHVCSSCHKHQIGYSSDSMSVIFKGS